MSPYIAYMDPMGHGVEKSIEISVQMVHPKTQKKPAALSMARQAVLRLQPCHGNFTAGETHGVGGFRPKLPKKNKRVNQCPDPTLRLPLLQDPSLRLPSAKGNLAEEIVVLGEYRKKLYGFYGLYNISMNIYIYIGIYYTIFYVYIFIYYIYIYIIYIYTTHYKIQL